MLMTARTTTLARRGLSTLHIVLIVVGVLAVLAITCVGLLAALVLPAVATARDAARSFMSSAQLMQIEMSRDLYANTYRDRDEPPPAFTLQLLIDEQYITPELANSPRGPVSDGRGDFWVNPVLIPEDDAPSRLASYDRAMYELGNNVAICFYNGECDVVDLAEFTRLLELPVNAGVDFDLPTRLAAQ